MKGGLCRRDDMSRETELHGCHTAKNKGKQRMPVSTVE